MQSVSWKQMTMAVILAAVASSTSAAEPGVSVTPSGAIMHEALPAPPGTRASVPVFVYDPLARKGQPREFQRDGMSFPAPSSSRPAGIDEAHYASGGVSQRARERATSPKASGTSTFDPRGSLGDEALPDRDTEKEGTISYHASFDPSIVPFKRNRVLDHVSDSGSLTVRRSSLEAIEVQGVRAAPDREVFWGSVMLEGKPGDTIPLPSVAADSRILSVEASPTLPLTFFRDGADNLYVRPEFDTGTQGKVRIVFLMDAAKHYFTRRISSALSLSDIPRSRRPNLPPSMRSAAHEVAAALGLSDSESYQHVLATLVRHFRSFEPGSPPRDSGNLYKDLALSKRGICRHRSYAFIVTAHGLGIPARYVFNEAHVFVEVWVPGAQAGWLRIDLGGSAERLVIAGAEDKIRHTPDGQDPFDMPPSFARDMRDGPSGGASSVVGLPPTRRERANTPSIPEPPRRRGLLPPPTALKTRPGAKPSHTTLSILSPIIYRGEPFDIAGRVTRAEGAPSAGHVRLLLIDATRGSVVGLLQTIALSSEGTYNATVTIPEAQAPGAYELIAEYMGDALSAPSRSP